MQLYTKDKAMTAAERITVLIAKRDATEGAEADAIQARIDALVDRLPAVEDKPDHELNTELARIYA